MSEREVLANDKFACSERERLAFEAGIKLATVYHQYVGTPFNSESVSMLEESIARSIEVQPFVTSARISIDRSVFCRGDDTYSYVSLTGDMIDAVVKLRMGSSEVTAEMRFFPELDYPLMYVSEIR